MRGGLTCALGAAVVAAALGGCGVAPDESGAADRYLGDPSWRRSALIASLVNPTNDYSALRLLHYASGDSGDWDLLPEWNPPVELVAPTELDAPGGASPSSLSPSATPLALPDGVLSDNDPRLLALGREAFGRYPVQLAPHWAVALTSRATAARYGLWIDAARGAVGGLVRARMADGSGALMITCSTCHAAPLGGSLADGLPNALLDTGAAILAAAQNPTDPALAAAMGSWGPGRLDVTTVTGTEPVRIPDLRPTRWLTYLQQDATVRQGDLAALAIRIETLIIVSHNQVTRPPRRVALALAAYVASLFEALPSTETATAASPAGATLFASNCGACHTAPGLTGDPVPLAAIGTDPTFGLSEDRGTGSYRVPSLHGVGTRGPLLHDGTIPSLGAMFDPARTTPAFAERLHGPGAVLGHPFGLDLGASDRAALLAFLDAL